MTQSEDPEMDEDKGEKCNMEAKAQAVYDMVTKVCSEVTI